MSFRPISEPAFQNWKNEGDSFPFLSEATPSRSTRFLREICIAEGQSRTDLPKTPTKAPRHGPGAGL